MERIFLGLYNFFNSRKILFWLFLILSFAIVGFFASQIRTDEDITKILPGSKNAEEYQRVVNNSALMEKMIVRVAVSDTTAGDPDQLVAYANAFVNQIKEKKELKPLLNDIRERVPDQIMMKAYEVFYNNLPLFLEEQDYKRFDTIISEKGIAEGMQNNYHALMSPLSMVVKQQIKTDPLHFTTIVLSRLQGLQLNDNYELYDGYILSKDRKSLLLLLTPSNAPTNTAANTALIKGLDEIIGNLKTEHKEVNASYFGGHAVAVGNAQQIQSDIHLTVTVAIIFIGLLLWIFFRKISLAFIIILPIAFGVGFALAIIYWIKDSISLIAIGGGAVIIGIAVDYSIHVFTHYRHTRSIPAVIKDLSVPLLIGNISTVGAFFCLLFVKSEILFDFGLFSGFSLIGAILFTLIFLPHLIPPYSADYKPKEYPGITGFFNRIGNSKIFFRVSLFLIFILTFLFLFNSNDVAFESDLNKLNYISPQLKETEDNLNKENSVKGKRVFLLFQGKDLNTALKRNEVALTKIDSLKTHGIVSKYNGVTAILMSDSLQSIRMQRWENYWTEEKKVKLKSDIERIAPAYGFKVHAFGDFFQWLDKDFGSLSMESTKDLKDYFLKDYISTRSGDMTVITSVIEIQEKDKEKVYKDLASVEGMYILDKQFLVNKFVKVVEEDFNQILFSSSCIVFILLLLFYGRMELALIAFIPMMISWLWIVGFMSLFDLHFNIVNVIISTFIFGLGDDYSIFMMEGLLMEYRNGTKNLSSYKISIFLSALTTLFGMGVLILADHPALKSIALISVIGIICVVVISYALIPMFFKAFISNRVKKGLRPITLLSLFQSLPSFIFFGLGSFLMVVIGFVIFKVLRLNGGKAKLLYHYLIMYFSRIILYGNFYVKKRWLNESNERLSKPAIIVANHQSFLDILILLAYHPKVVLFTNKWVWNSPILGPVVRMAGFFCVDEGVENSIEMVRKTTQIGYSVAIFPEGTRSVDRTIHRFHKGAFYLAEQLQLDIVPVTIYGTGHCLPKNDFIVKKADLVIKISDRIKANDTVYGVTYQERSKSICQLIRKEYAAFKSLYETPEYYFSQLMQKYIYKGPVLEWYLRIKVKLEKNYKTLHELMPLNGKIYDLGCGYGFSTYMLSFLSSNREIIGVDYDEDKVSVANHAKSDSDQITFIASDVRTYNFNNADGIILSDVLHYFPLSEQGALVKKCIENLNPGGVLVVRDANADLMKRHRGTKISEFFSVKVFNFNKTEAQNLYFISSKEMIEILKPMPVEVKILDETKMNSNIIYHIRKSK